MQWQCITWHIFNKVIKPHMFKHIIKGNNYTGCCIYRSTAKGTYCIYYKSVSSITVKWAKLEASRTSLFLYAWSRLRKLAFITMMWYWIQTTVTHKLKGFTSANIHQPRHIFPPAHNKTTQNWIFTNTVRVLGMHDQYISIYVMLNPRWSEYISTPLHSLQI